MKKDSINIRDKEHDAASEEHEVQCHGGVPPPCAQELAMAVLMAEVTFNFDGKVTEIVMMRYPQGELYMKWMLL